MTASFPTDLNGELREKITNAVRVFMDKMNRWEVECYKQSAADFDDTASDGSLERRMRSGLLNIFSEHVVENGRNYHRLENLGCGRNPEYDPVHDQIGEIEWDGRRAKITIQKKTGLRATYRLAFGLDGVVCKIARRELLSASDKWGRTYIYFLSSRLCQSASMGSW